MDHTHDYRDKLEEASKTVSPTSVRFTPGASRAEAGAEFMFGTYVIEIQAPCFECACCTKMEPGQPTNLDRHIDTSGDGGPWSRKAKYSFDFGPPIDWIVDSEGTLCYECGQGVERTRSMLFSRAREIYIEQRRKELGYEPQSIPGHG